MASNTTVAMNDIVTCGICLDYYEDPRLLPCSHTYCFKCIKQLIKDGKMTCPLRDGTVIDEKNINQLPINRIVMDMVELVTKTSGDTVASECENCLANPSEYWCSKCESLFCTTCSKLTHAPKALQNHPIVSAKVRPSSHMCLDHPDEKIKYWCSTCESLTCRDCLLFKHKNHTFVPLQEILLTFKSKIQSSLGPVREKLQKTKVKIDATIVSHKQHYKETAANIEKSFARLHQALDLRKAELIRKLDQSRANEMITLEKWQSNTAEQLQMIGVRDISAKQILGNADEIQIIRMSPRLFECDKQIYKHYQKNTPEYSASTIGFKESSGLEQQISVYGAIVGREVEVRRKMGSVQWTLSLSSGTEFQSPYEVAYARGYVFQLRTPIKIISVTVKGSIYGSICAYILNNEGKIIEEASSPTEDPTMKWTTIPIVGELKDGYSLCVFSSDTRGKFAYKYGNNNLRAINNDCSVESKYACTNDQLRRGGQLSVLNNTCSIEMMINVEQKQ